MLIHKYRTIRSLKICYWGSSMSGKTLTITAIKIMKSLEEPKGVFDFVTVADQETGRTVFFDQAVFGFGNKPETEEYLFKIHVFTTAGQKRLKETRKVVLQGIHGLVIVVDADLENWEENIWSLKELKALKGDDIVKNKIPYIVLVNKQDLAWGTKISHKHVKQLFDAADVSDVFPDLEGRVFSGSCLQAKDDLEQMLRNTPRDILLDTKGNFKREHRPESFNPLMKSLESIVKLVIKQQLAEK
ncbi:MAG: ADP-ribosylation factor-like protein [Candidatus Heimdallarchaeota archaeon]